MQHQRVLKQEACSGEGRRPLAVAQGDHNLLTHTVASRGVSKAHLQEKEGEVCAVCHKARLLRISGWAATGYQTISEEPAAFGKPVAC